MHYQSINQSTELIGRFQFTPKLRLKIPAYYYSRVVQQSKNSEAIQLQDFPKVYEYITR